MAKDSKYQPGPSLNLSFLESVHVNFFESNTKRSMTKSWVIKYDSFQWWCLNLPEFNFKYSTFICLNLIYSKFKTFLWVFELENRFFILLISFVYSNLQRKSWIRIPDYQYRVYKEKGTHLQRFSTDIGVIFQDIPGIIFMRIRWRLACSVQEELQILDISPFYAFSPSKPCCYFDLIYEMNYFFIKISSGPYP